MDVRANVTQANPKNQYTFFCFKHKKKYLLSLYLIQIVIARAVFRVGINDDPTFPFLYVHHG